MMKKLLYMFLWLLILAGPAQAGLPETDNTARLTSPLVGQALALPGSIPPTRNA